MKSELEIARIARAFRCSVDEAKTAEYLGDSVYATHDGYQVWLRTFDGINVNDTIALEPSVIAELYSYCGAFMARDR